MFSDPLTSQDQYWIGYIRADGGLYSKIGQEYKPGKYRAKGGWLQFGQTFQEPVEALLNYVNGQGKVSKRELITNFGPSVMYVMNSSKPYYALEALGVKAKLREDFYQSKHFWRGLCDGDGTITWVKNRGILYPCIAFSGSEKDMTELSEYLQNLGYKAPKVGICRSVFRIALNGSPAQRFIQYLYQNEYSAHPQKRENAQACILWKPRQPNMAK